METRKRLVIFGYGKMGKLVEQLAPEYGFDTVARTTSRNEAISLEGIDVAIEFSTPTAAPENLTRLARAGIPTVCGTTGWFDRLPEAIAEVEKNDTALVWSANFSVGVAVFGKVVGFAAAILRNEPDYGAWAWEIHHEAKKDAPSGTLLHLVEAMRRNGYTNSVNTSASRAGKHPGTHEIGFDSSYDTITLRHTARSREGFARGALRSALWIADRKGVYTFDDVLFGAP